MRLPQESATYFAVFQYFLGTPSQHLTFLQLRLIPKPKVTYFYFIPFSRLVFNQLSGNFLSLWTFYYVQYLVLNHPVKDTE